MLKKGIEEAAKTAFTDCPGNQEVAEIEFRFVLLYLIQPVYQYVISHSTNRLHLSVYCNSFVG